ncbi:hypothetical protein KIPB_011668, partial [Kipferlia bialata]
NTPVFWSNYSELNTLYGDYFRVASITQYRPTSESIALSLTMPMETSGELIKECRLSVDVDLTLDTSIVSPAVSLTDTLSIESVGMATHTISVSAPLSLSVSDTLRPDTSLTSCVPEPDPATLADLLPSHIHAAKASDCDNQLHSHPYVSTMPATAPSGSELTLDLLLTLSPDPVPVYVSSAYTFVVGWIVALFGVFQLARYAMHKCVMSGRLPVQRVVPGIHTKNREE